MTAVTAPESSRGLSPPHRHTEIP